MTCPRCQGPIEDDSLGMCTPCACACLSDTAKALRDLGTTLAESGRVMRESLSVLERALGRADP